MQENYTIHLVKEIVLRHYRHIRSRFDEKNFTKVVDGLVHSTFALYHIFHKDGIDYQ